MEHTFLPPLSFTIKYFTEPSFLPPFTLTVSYKYLEDYRITALPGGIDSAQIFVHFNNAMPLQQMASSGSQA
jgi:hypothetical protein